MEIVINIPDEVYDRKMLIPVIQNGVPLPKGHGRIVDIDKILEEMRTTRTYDIPFVLERVKPIIEADGGNED